MANIVSPLTNFGFIKTSGSNVVEFLQGQLTCDVSKLEEDGILQYAYCNEKGRMSASGYVIKDGKDYLLMTPKLLLANTMQKLKQYAIFSNIIVTEEDMLMALGYVGKTKAIKLPKKTNKIEQITSKVKAACLDKEHNIYAVIANKKDMSETQEKLTAAKDALLYLDLGYWEAANIKAGIVHVYPNTLERLTPHMVNYHNSNAVSFEKGCYLGQEIVARTQHKGRLKRKLYSGVIEDSNIKIGDEIVMANKETVGIIVANSCVEENKTSVLAVISDHAASSSVYVSNMLIEDISISCSELALA